MDLKPLVRYIIRVVYPGTLLLILWEVSEVPAQSDMTIQALPGDELIPYAAFAFVSGVVIYTLVRAVVFEWLLNRVIRDRMFRKSSSHPSASNGNPRRVVRYFVHPESVAKEARGPQEAPSDRSRTPRVPRHQVRMDQRPASDHLPVPAVTRLFLFVCSRQHGAYYLGLAPVRYHLFHLRQRRHAKAMPYPLDHRGAACRRMMASGRTRACTCGGADRYIGKSLICAQMETQER